MCTQAVYNNKHLAYWKLDLGCPQIMLESYNNIVHRLILSAYPCRYFVNVKGMQRRHQSALGFQN